VRKKAGESRHALKLNRTGGFRDRLATPRQRALAMIERFDFRQHWAVREWIASGADVDTLPVHSMGRTVGDILLWIQARSRGEERRPLLEQSILDLADVANLAAFKKLLADSESP